MVNKKGDLLKVAFYTNRKETDVLAVRCGLLNESCIDNLFVLAQGTATTVTYLEGADQLFDKLVGMGS